MLTHGMITRFLQPSVDKKHRGKKHRLLRYIGPPWIAAVDLALAELGPPDGRSLSRIAGELALVTIGDDGYMFRLRV